MTTTQQSSTDLTDSRDTRARLSADSFKSIFRQHPAGVTVVTLAHDDRLVGFTATSVISVSAEPPLLAFSVAGGSSSWSALAEASSVVVNFLSAAQAELSTRFATTGIDRFGIGGWSLLSTGEPVLHNTQHWIRALIVDRIPIGSSFLVSLEAVEGGDGAESGPLVYHDRAYHSLSTDSAL
jgi:flavin reductase (DIM6/NTAB) family NADH-FMN oxidoreductase RutF